MNRIMRESQQQKLDAKQSSYRKILDGIQKMQMSASLEAEERELKLRIEQKEHQKNQELNAYLSSMGIKDSVSIRVRKTNVYKPNVVAMRQAKEQRLISKE